MGYEIDGRKFRTKQAVINAFGLNVAELYMFIDRTGIPFSDSAQFFVDVQKGRTDRTLEEYVKELESVKESIPTPEISEVEIQFSEDDVELGVSKIVKINGLVFLSRADACRYFKIHQSTVTTYMNKMGISFTESLQHYINRLNDASDEFCEYEVGKSMFSRGTVVYMEEEKFNQVNPVDFLRLKKRQQPFTVRGKQYSFIIDACNDHGVHIGDICYYCGISNGTLEEAFEFYLSQK